MAETFVLRFFDDNDVMLAEFTTDASDEYPYLCTPTNFAAQEINFGSGRATIGSVRCEVIDPPLTPGNQNTGTVTAILPAANGLTALIGRPAHLLARVGEVEEMRMRGVVDDIELGAEFSSYIFTLKDQRENERRTRAFVKATTSSVLPRGIVDGFGVMPDGSLLVPPVTPLSARYGELEQEVLPGYSITSCGFYFATPPKPDDQFRPAVDQIVTDAMVPQFATSPDDVGLMRHQRIRILWRYAGETEWNVVEDVLASLQFPLSTLSGVAVDSEGKVEVRWLQRFDWIGEPGQVRPESGDIVEVVFGYNAEPNENYPLHYEGMAGELLAAMFDAEFSEDGVPLVEYDEAAVAFLNDPLVARITAPLDDEDGIWRWVEENIYAVTRSAPTLDIDGRISPVRYELPDEDEELPQLDDTNCEPLAGWSHTGSDAINVVEVTYDRLYLVPADRDPAGRRSKGDGLAARKITVRHEHIASIAILGERPLKIKAATLCAFGGIEGEAFNGDVAKETGAQLAAKVTVESTDRFVLGGQHFAVQVSRTDIGNIRPGQWFIGACSWWPEYETGQRGANRLVQAVRVVPLDEIGYALELIDAGPDNVPVGTPTVDEESAVVNADGSITLQVTALAVDSEARIDYAVNETAPATNSGLWEFAARTATVGPVSTPAHPAGSRVWIRYRGEAPGRRPSAWSIPFPVDVAAVPRVSRARVTIDRRGIPTVTYTPNAYAGGVRIYYSVHHSRTSPTFTLYQDFAATGSNVLNLQLRAGEVLDARIDAYEGMWAGAVSGARGSSAYARAAFAPNASSLSLSKFGKRSQTDETVTVGGIPGALVDQVFVFEKDYLEPEAGEEAEIPEIDPDTDFPVAILDPADADERGFLLHTYDRPARGTERYTWWIPIGFDGAEGRTEMMRIDPKPVAEAPYFDRLKQTGFLSTVDVFGRVVDPAEDAEGGMLYVWVNGSDFSGDPDGDLAIDAVDMPFSFGPGTVFSGGALLNDIVAPLNQTTQIALRFDTADGRTTGQVIIPVKLDLSDVIDEYGNIVVQSWLDAMEVATNASGVGVGEVLPPDGDDYITWYKPSTNTLYQWDGDSWEVLEGTSYLAVADLIVGKAVFGAIGVEAIAAGAIKTKLLEVTEKLSAANLSIGALSLIASDLGAIVSGTLTNTEETAGLNLNAVDTEPFLYHPNFVLRENGAIEMTINADSAISFLDSLDAVAGSITPFEGAGIKGISFAGGAAVLTLFESGPPSATGLLLTTNAAFECDDLVASSVTATGTIAGATLSAGGFDLQFTANGTGPGSVGRYVYVDDA